MQVKDCIRPDILRGLLHRLGVAYLCFWARTVVRLQQPFIIGVTGSVGKTTTTEMIAAVLTHQDATPIVGRVGKSSENMNDDVGLPLAVLGYTSYYASWMRDDRRKFVTICSLPFPRF